MTQRTRVTPFGDIVDLPFRGVWTGNRGRLHEGDRVVRYSRGDLWIVCALEFHGRHSELWRPGRFTWLFFQDEAQAFAAGHRPCGECRHAAYQDYVACWQAAAPEGGRPTATEMNRTLQRERLIPRTTTRRVHPLAWSDLPDGTFVLLDGQDRPVEGVSAAPERAGRVPTRAVPAGPEPPRPTSAAPAPTTALVLGDALVPWVGGSYGAPIRRPRSGVAVVVTPPSTVAVLRAGYPVQIDDRALHSVRDRG
jgi:hypothetical protein